jgi:hypothetical protein
MVHCKIGPSIPAIVPEHRRETAENPTRQGFLRQSFLCGVAAGPGT